MAVVQLRSLMSLDVRVVGNSGTSAGKSVEKLGTPRVLGPVPRSKCICSTRQIHHLTHLNKKRSCYCDLAPSTHNRHAPPTIALPHPLGALLSSLALPTEPIVPELAEALKATAPATADAALASASGYIVKPNQHETLVGLVHHLQVGWGSWTTNKHELVECWFSITFRLKINLIKF